MKGWVVVSRLSGNFLGIKARGHGELSALGWMTSKDDALRFASHVQAFSAAEQWPNASPAVFHASVA